MTFPLDEVLKRLRRSELDASKTRGYTPAAQATWKRLTTATADWVDVIRTAEGGSYDVALAGLAAIAAAMPAPPHGSGQDQLDLDSLGPKALEAPEGDPA